MIPSVFSIIISMVVLGNDTVVLRDGLGELKGNVLASDDSSLRLQSDDESLMQIPWDQVRRIEFGSESLLQEQLAARLERAEKIWRARSRLQRGDYTLAEPLFAALFMASPDRTSETDLIIAEGLLRCRLERGSMEESILPSLEVARLARLGVRTDRYEDLLPVSDLDQPLCHYLPPVWVNKSKLTRLARELREWDAGGDQQLAEVAKQYVFLVEHPSGFLEIDPRVGFESSIPLEKGDGSELLRLAILSRDSSPDERRRSRILLRSKLNRGPVWQDAWLHFMLGISLLHEEGDGLRRQGLVELAWLPAKYANEQPYLSGVAMAMMADELARQGNLDSARLLLGELRAQFSHHPVFNSDDFLSGDWIKGDSDR